MKPGIALTLILAGTALILYSLNECGRPKSPEMAIGSEPVSYDGSVYYFDSIQSFGFHLAAFIKAHPELRVIAVAPLDNGPYGSTRGYWVVVDKQKLELTK